MIAPLFGASYGQTEDSRTIRMNNRPLVSFHGKVITLFDVVQDMDKRMEENSPESLLTTMGRMQFYEKHWKEALELMIQRILVIKEAEELGIQISDAQLYEEVDTQFGPNVIQTLNEKGMTLEEAKRKAYEDIVINYMHWIRIYQKAFQNVSPEKLEIAYGNYLKQNPPIETYSYQIVSIRSPKDPYEEIAAKIAPFISNTNISDVEGLVAKLQSGLKNQTTIQVSKPFNVNASQMSTEHLSILSNLVKNTCSQPILQNSRQDSTPVMRIFYLLDHQKQDIPSFDQLESMLKNELTSQEIAKAQNEYFTKLKKRYRCDRDDFYHMIPDNYQPFSIE